MGDLIIGRMKLTVNRRERGRGVNKGGERINGFWVVDANTSRVIRRKED